MLGQVLLVVCCLIPLVRCWPRGAGTEACLTFSPHHNSTTAQTVSPPYRVTVSASSMYPGSTVTVTLSATDDGTFRGFLVQARCSNCTTADTAIVPGTFAKVNSADPANTMNCEGGSSNSMTHTNNTDKTSVSFKWTAPASVDVKQGIEFRAAVVKTFTEWWPDVRSSPVVYVSSATVSMPVFGLVLVAMATMVMLSY